MVDPGPERPHTPPPTLWPVGFAAGVAILLLGLLVGWHIVVLGAILTVAFGFLWARDVVAGAGPPPAPPERVMGAGAAPVPTAAATQEAALPVMDDEEVARYPRNVFLELTTLGFAGVIGGLITLPVIGFAILPAFEGNEEDEVDVGPLENFPEGEWRVVTFMKDPAAGEVSRRTAFVRNNGTLNGLPSFTVISNRCAHLGCPTQPGGPLSEEETKELRTSNTRVTLIPTEPSAFSCPCHGGSYDTEGNRTAGPPVRALDRYEFFVRNGRLFLGKTFSVGEVEGEGKNARITRYPLMYPGEHVDGIQQFLYPIPAP